jgi:hypothetical protein
MQAERRCGEMPKSRGMGRTNVILLAMGILACLVLSLLMHRGLKLQTAARTDPVVKAVTEVFGGRLQVPPRFRINNEGGRRVGVLQLVPELPSQRLTKDVGRFVWQQAPGRFDNLVILLKQNVEDEGTPVPIPKPFLARRPPVKSPVKSQVKSPVKSPVRSPVKRAAKPPASAPVKPPAEPPAK